MSYLLVPHEVTPTTATIWVGAVSESPDAAQVMLRYNEGQPVLDAAQWQTWVSRNAAHRLDYQRFPLTGLQPGKTYSLELLVNGKHEADGRVTTLPMQLPTLGQKPFTVFLGSCFCRLEDEEAKVGNTYWHLPAGARPDVKILSGDQVYLDAPWLHYLLHTHDVEELESEFFLNYQKTWTQQAGFQQLLKDGANYFTSDDHEFWNNAPNRAAYVRDTWPLSDHRRQWSETARQLYEIFQTPATMTRFTVGTLSFLIADTRLNRDERRKKLMTDLDLDEVEQWIQGLKGPGVLAVGQPIFSGKTSTLTGTLGDWGLPDYEQYSELVRRLASTTHSVVVLTGDVHYGRVASCALASGGELIEIISSPLSLVDKKAEGEWQAAPSSFPSFEIPGVVKALGILTEESFSLNKSHFLTLEFLSHGPHVNMTVKVWPIVPYGTLPNSITITERTLR